MLSWIHEKMAIQKLAPGDGRFFAFDSIVAGNGPSRFPPHNIECKKGET